MITCQTISMENAYWWFFRAYLEVSSNAGNRSYRTVAVKAARRMHSQESLAHISNEGSIDRIHLNSQSTTFSEFSQRIILIQSLVTYRKAHILEIHNRNHMIQELHREHIQHVPPHPHLRNSDNVDFSHLLKEYNIFSKEQCLGETISVIHSVLVRKLTNIL